MSAAPEPTAVFPLCPEVKLPDGVPESALREFLESVRVTEGAPDELQTYCREDFWRFVRTYNLVAGLQGKCLELGANPYFTTMLLREFTDLELVLANYFGSPDRPKRPRLPGSRAKLKQTVIHRDFASGRRAHTVLTSRLFNMEAERFPFDDDSFDIVLFCEIIEHLVADPLGAIREIKRVLRPNGVLILTTPNVNRLENVVKMVAGVNVFDPYSAYGLYGRHSREYNKHELHLLLTYAGFEIESLESADVHDNSAAQHMAWEPLVPLLRHRERDLGQYLFLRASNRRPGGTKRPDFLYRSYPADAVEAVSTSQIGHGA
jgi:SAM-dependent methyltransferase